EPLEREAAQMGALGGEDDVGGPVPEVGAIAHGPEESERPDRERPRDEAPRRADGAHDEHERSDLREPQPSVVEKRAVAAEPAPGHAETDGRRETEHVEQTPRSR